MLLPRQWQVTTMVSARGAGLQRSAAPFTYSERPLHGAQPIQAKRRIQHKACSALQMHQAFDHATSCSKQHTPSLRGKAVWARGDTCSCCPAEHSQTAAPLLPGGLSSWSSHQWTLQRRILQQTSALTAQLPSGLSPSSFSGSLQQATMALNPLVHIRTP